MTDQEITEVIQSLHPDLQVGEMELRVGRAIAFWESQACAKIAEMPNMAQSDIARVIRERTHDPR